MLLPPTQNGDPNAPPPTSGPLQEALWLGSPDVGGGGQDMEIKQSYGGKGGRQVSSCPLDPPAMNVPGWERGGWFVLSQYVVSRRTSEVLWTI